jgi:glycosyltransferase involved in cell wall biosynthesis
LLRDEIARQGLAGRFHLLPARREVAPLLHACNVFVLPSLEEGLSNALLEAMACSKPCVSSRVGGCQYLIADGERGFLVEAGDVQALADRIARYLGDNELRETHGRNAAEFVREHHSVERMVRDYEALYEEIASPGR